MAAFFHLLPMFKLQRIGLLMPLFLSSYEWLGKKPGASRTTTGCQGQESKPSDGIMRHLIADEFTTPICNGLRGCVLKPCGWTIFLLETNKDPTAGHQPWAKKHQPTFLEQFSTELPVFFSINQSSHFPEIFLRLLGSFLVTRRFTEKFMMEREVREAYSNTNQGIAVPWRRMYRVGHARAKWLFRWISWEYHGCLGPIEHHGHIPREYHQSWFIYQCLVGQSSKIRHCPWLVSVYRVMSETKFEGWSGWWWTG